MAFCQNICIEFFEIKTIFSQFFQQIGTSFVLIEFKHSVFCTEEINSKLFSMILVLKYLSKCKAVHCEYQSIDKGSKVLFQY